MSSRRHPVAALAAVSAFGMAFAVLTVAALSAVMAERVLGSAFGGRFYKPRSGE